MTGISSFMCSAEDCLCWIIVLLNILTIFYLVFCAWFKITKFVRLIGYIWASVLAVGSVIIVAIHTCIFTLLTTVFSALVIFAVLSVALNKGIFAQDSKEDKPKGSYVIHKTDKDNYAFAIYNNKKEVLAKSYYKYSSMEEVKKAILACRELGLKASVQDRTKEWVDMVDYPKFELLKKEESYCFFLLASDEVRVLKSVLYSEYEPCRKSMKSATSAVKSTKIYFAENELLSDDIFAIKK